MCGRPRRARAAAAAAASRHLPAPAPLPRAAPQGIGSTVTRTGPAGSTLLEDAPHAPPPAKAAAGKRKAVAAEDVEAE